jgi:tetratricopeptide (TPR) repeat protein
LPLVVDNDYKLKNLRDSWSMNFKSNAQIALSTLALMSATNSAGATHTNEHTVPIDPKVAGLVKKAASAFTLKQYDLAIRTYSEALKMKPETITAAAIYSWRAGAYGKNGEFAKGMSDAREAIRLNPQYFNGYNERGIIYRRIGNPDQAISSFDTAIHLNPTFARAYNNRANAYSDKGEYNQAIRDYSEAIRRQDRTMQSDFYVNRAGTYQKMGDYRRAASDLERASGLSPNDYYVLNGLAWFQATCPEDSLRNGKQALEKSKKASELAHWQDYHPVDTLACACAELSDFDDAIKYETQALHLKGINANTRQAMQERLDLYRQRKPYRQSKFRPGQQGEQ